MILETIAGDVAVGDTLLDLDNGYVIDVSTDEYDNVSIVFHDVGGNECQLVVGEDHPLRIETPVV